MSADIAQSIHALRAELDVLEEALKTALNACGRSRAQAATIQLGLSNGLNAALTQCSVPITEHRRAHRSGRPPKLDTDPELRAFVLARIDRMTYPELAKAVADAFPPNRRIGKSAIHSWWQNQNPATISG